MKYSQWIGIAAALLLVGACYLPWAYFPDVHKDFTGFFSENNAYGRPGIFLIFFCCIAIPLFLIPRVWAKRTNLVICAMTFAFSMKTFILYTACYRGICPEKHIGIFLVLLAPMIMIAAAALPDIKLKETKR
jgi:hypothetical protein